MNLTKFIKKILLIFIIVLFTMLSFNNVFAEETNLYKDSLVRTTEDIPGLECKCIAIKDGEDPDCQSPETRLYECKIEGGFSGVYKMLKGFILFAVIVVALGSVLMFIVAGMRLSISGIDSSQREPAKKQISRIIYGLIVLLLSGWLLATLFPFIFR